MSRCIFKILFLVLAIHFLSGQVFAQKKWTADFEGAISLAGKKMEGINVIVLKNGSQVATTTSNKVGRYSVTLEPENEYLIKFEKAGLVTKSLSVNTKGVPDEVINVDGFQFIIPADVTMLEDIPGVDFSLLNKPVGKFSYDPETQDLNFDEAYTNSILTQIEQLQLEYDQKIKLEKALNDKYNLIIARADKAFAAKNYEGAKTDFTEASGLKPKEKYPKDKLVEIEGLIANLNKDKELNEKYTAAIAKADKAFSAKDYPGAKSGYNEALALKSAEQYPKTRISEIDKLLAEAASKSAAEKELNDKYNAAIAKGDRSFSSKDYTAAKVGFAEALALKPTEQYPKTKIAEIDKLLVEEANKNAKEKELNDKYNAAIAKADKAFSAKDYPTAKTGYNEALALKSAEQYPKTQLSEIDKLLGDLAAEKERLAKEKELNDKYNAAIAKADKAFTGKDYPTAKAGYNEALALKSAEQHPKTKLAEIDKLLGDLEAEKERLAKEKELNDKYNAAIAKADKAFTTKDYEGARAGFNEALALKSAEQYPKTKLAEIDKLLGDLAAQQAAEKERLAKEKELNAKYNAAIAKADQAFTGKDYASAKTSYNEALALKSAEQYPKTKLAEIEKLLGDLAAQQAAEKERLAKEKELNDKYNAAIAKADKAFTAKDYPGAKTGYNEALALKSAEQYPKTQLSEIDKLLGDLAAKEAAEKERLAKEKELNDKYNAAIAKADKAFSAKDYPTAKAGYNEALALKSAEQHPKTKLAEIDKLLGDLEAEKERLAKEKELNDKYSAAIAKADKAFATKDYEGARAGFNEALALKSAEQYPKTKLAEIDKLLGDLAAQQAAEKERLAKEKELNDKYNAAIAKADQAFTDKDYTSAKVSYNDALALKSAEQYPKTKLSEIEKLLGDLAAQQAAEKERLAKEKELNDKYNAAIAKADKAFTAKDYAGAKTGYNEALALKSAEQYPKTQLSEIDKMLGNLAAQQAAEKERLAKEKELNDKYNAAIAKADQAFTGKDYTSAKAGYNEALALKSGEQYPKTKLSEIDKLLGDLATQQAAEKERLAKEKELNDKYNAAIALGDKTFTAKSYKEAQANYNEASRLKPLEKYPKDKLAELDKIFAGLAANDAAEKARLAKEKELNTKYTAAIARGDQAFNTKEYNASKLAYKEALALKANEKYPNDRIAEIDDILAEINRAKETDTKYKAAIAKGDQAFTAKNYPVAKTGYNEALALKPNEQYPKTKLSEIDRILAEIAAKTPAVKETPAPVKKEHKSAIGLTAKEKEEFINALALKYPQGVTEETYEEAGKKVIRRIVVKGNLGAEYTKVIQSFGTYYFKNGDIPISQYKFDTETKP